jgi:hypothetical protein
MSRKYSAIVMPVYTLASRAATGMLDVLATSTVRLHQGLARVRVDELGELHQHVGHLVTTLAAADEDDDLGVRPLGDLVLGNGLARTERPGDAGNPTHQEREERVDDTGAGHKRLVQRQLAPVGTRARAPATSA